MLRARYGEYRGVVREGVSKGSVWLKDVCFVVGLSDSFVRKVGNGLETSF